MKVAPHISTGRDIHAAVEAELEWTPEVNAAGIGVAVDDGVVTLSGVVEVYAQRAPAKRAALRVRGVTLRGEVSWGFQHVQVWANLVCLRGRIIE